MSIYEIAIAGLQDQGALTSSDSVLVTCGGDTDARALRRRGLKNVLVTNLDTRRSAGIGSYGWQRCDAENLDFTDDQFDWGMIHAGLHHCASPHRGLLELLRVARKGVLVIEARDSLLIRLAVRLGLTSAYEIEDVALGGTGLRDTGIPNFIYRWTEREVRKAVESALPGAVNEIRYFYGLVLPEERMTMASAPKRAVYRVASMLARLLFAIAPKQGNQFAFAIFKTDAVKPWIKRSDAGIALDSDYALGFEPANYVREVVADDA